MKYIFLSALLGLASANAHAGSVSNGKVTHITVNSVGMAFVSAAGTRTPGPPCSTADRMAINTATPGGKALYAAALVAYQSGKSIHLVGNATCALWGDSEDLLYLLVN